MSTPLNPSASSTPRTGKGEQTRAAILAAALDLAARDGLEGLTIGLISERTGMSKSGVFAHFGSREELQIAVLSEYHRVFRADVFEPALALPRGLPRLEAMVANWIRRVCEVEIPHGCLYVSSAAEFDDRPGAVRDALCAMVEDWQAALRRALAQAVDEGHLRPGLDPDQFIHELYGNLLALHHQARLLRDARAADRARIAFARLIDSCRAPAG
ncbi:TetR/AcrR family transcriptional regulator [Derxia gummosa]|uniref:TetR/AcrR family transcriptional regulator n=1 Tax=Derxia gummosa DSM 723 TaxID=1121388 RepID=A0A8B6X5P7_9BURK|nr:TetR/AcrR family transcriptional regulator [Derxia gummosa]